jgi:hypothetical protein
MYLATVTCNRDIPQLILQAESIQKFLAPCKHVIIINEENPDLDFYKRWLSPYYTRHELEILPRIEYFYPVTGFRKSIAYFGTGVEWRIQQLQKLLLAYTFDDDYILLDSKNFFIKDISLEYYEDPNFYGSGVRNDNKNKHYIETTETYRKLLNANNTITTTPSTPFKIHHKLLTSRCKLEELGYKLFSPEFTKSGVTSEFLFYSTLISDVLSKVKDWRFTPPRVFWKDPVDIDNVTQLLNTIQYDHTFITGFHRDFLASIGPKELKTINSWLKFSIGLDSSINPIPRDKEMSCYNP